jgi:spore maturation protein CgeB
MKILVIGNFKWEFYENALCEGFIYHNIEVIKNKVEYLNFKDILFSKKIKKINNDFIKLVEKTKPNVLFIYRSNEILLSTLKVIKEKYPYVKVVLYHNDNPYIGLKNKIKYRNFLLAHKIADLVYVYRPSNIYLAKQLTKAKVKLLLPHYYSKKDLNSNINFEHKQNDLVFIGHYEKDREIFIDFLFKNDLNIKIYGDRKWKEAAYNNNWPLGNVFSNVYGKEYSKVINNSKIALCFLSKKNRDVYTRRNFEIPASGTLVLSEYTKELNKLFKDECNILFFRNKEEMVYKIKKYLNNEKALKKLTLNAFNTVTFNERHSEKNRAYKIIKDLRSLCNENL